MTSTLLTRVGAGMLALAIVATPALALARDNHYNPRAVGSGIEVLIHQNGRVIVRGAQVTNVSGDTISARTMWNDTTINWTVRTDNDTDFVRKSGSGSDIDDISSGDYVSFSGSFVGNGAFTVDADVVKNWSLSDARTVFTGRITDVDNNDFTLATANHGTITVETTGSTDYTGTLDVFADLEVDTRVVVYGSYDQDDRVLTATQIAGAGSVRADVHEKVKDRLGEKKWGTIFDRIFPGWFK